MRTCVLAITALSMATVISAQSLQVTQVDTGALLVRGWIEAYVSLSDQRGDIPAIFDPEAFSALERDADGVRPLEILDVTAEAAKETGVDFLLLVDNSGSMYDPFQDGTRIEYAQRALKSFVNSMAGSGDRAALGAFNTYLYPLARLGASTGEMIRSLDRIAPPASESAYTEFYQALTRFLPELASTKGRKAVIALSDGENYPFSRFSGVTHPIWEDQLVAPEEVIRRYREEEVTLYALNFAENRDPGLSRVAHETGGMVFEARDSSDLTTIYETIRETIRKEVRLRIRVPATKTAERNLTVEYEGASDDARYFAPLLLGAPGRLPWFVPVLIALAAAAGHAAPDGRRDADAEVGAAPLSRAFHL